MPDPNSLRALDAAEQFAADVEQLVLPLGLGVNRTEQLIKAAESGHSNISEAYGRPRGKDRVRFLYYSWGSVDETLGRLRGLVRARRITEKQFQPLRNRGVVIIRMVKALMRRES